MRRSVLLNAKDRKQLLVCCLVGIALGVVMVVAGLVLRHFLGHGNPDWDLVFGHGGYSTSDAVVFGAHAAGQGDRDLVGSQEHQVHGQVDLTPSLGGMDSELVGESHPTEQIFKSHRG